MTIQQATTRPSIPGYVFEYVPTPLASVLAYLLMNYGLQGH